jgi:hypothetical protein
MSKETEAKLSIHQILEKLDQVSSWHIALPRKLQWLLEPLRVLVSICVVLPGCVIAVDLYTLFILIPSLLADVSLASWKKAVRNRSFGK